MLRSEILFKKEGVIEVKNFAFHYDYENENTASALTIQHEFMKLGYIFDDYSFDYLTKCSLNFNEHIFTDVIPFIARMIGQGNYKPMYKGFPYEVFNMGLIELYTNAIFHYWSDGKWNPHSEVERITQFDSQMKFKIIRLVNTDEADSILYKTAKTLLSSNGALTEMDHDILKTLIAKLPMRDITILAVKEIPFKETLCMAYNWFKSRGVELKLKNVNDVLRIVAHESGGDETLTENTAFRKFNRSARRMILAMMEKTDCSVEDMNRHREKWLRLGERIHPGDYARQFPRSVSAFNILRNDKITNFQGQIDLALSQGDVELACKLLESRPGVFARQLDYLLRTFDSSVVMNSFIKVIDDVSVPVLIQLYGHFQNRLLHMDDEVQKSLVMIKGKKTKSKLLERKLPKIDEDIVHELLYFITESLEGRFAKMPQLGNVWIDEGLKDIPVPYAMRDTQEGLNALVRGSRIPLGDGNVIRAYAHWYDEKGMIDIDLSCNFLNANFIPMAECAYFRLKCENWAAHSGDIRHKKGRNAEYIDLDIDLALAKGIRYAMFDIRNFNGYSLKDVPECVFGWMERDKPRANEIFVPSTIRGAIPITSEAIASIVVCIDLEKRQAIWVDMKDANIALCLNPKGHFAFTEILNTSETKMSLYDLFAMHANARGTLVTGHPSKTDIDTAFEFELAYEYDKILAEYMGQ